MTDFKPCPFCGSDEEHLVITREGGGGTLAYYVVRCEPCDASGPTSGTTTAEARRLWNEREEEQDDRDEG